MASIDDTHISVRFKFGIHTIYVFVDPLGPISAVDKELLALVKDRYPEGLTASFDSPHTTPIPDDADVEIAYAFLTIPNDPTRGWTQLKINDRNDSASKCGLKQNSIVAFAFVENEDERAKFEVEWPKDDEEIEEPSG